MKVAVPTFGDRVSPRFDCARNFLVVVLEGQSLGARQELPAADWAPHERINRLVELGVDVVVCGGIDRWSAESLMSAGITLHRGVSGSIDESLRALGRGELAREMPLVSTAGYGRGRRRRRGSGADCPDAWTCE